jgi:hypothetical protein
MMLADTIHHARDAIVLKDGPHQDALRPAVQLIYRRKENKVQKTKIQTG